MTTLDSRGVPCAAVRHEASERIRDVCIEVTVCGRYVSDKCRGVCRCQIDKARIAVVGPDTVTRKVVRLVINGEFETFQIEIRGLEPKTAHQLALNPKDKFRLIAILAIFLKMNGG